MEHIKLSNRLRMNVELVNKTRCVADIGCDHAYAAIWLCQNDKADKVIAMDVNEGPVKRAIDNVKRYDLDDVIDVRLSDGTKQLNKGEADTLLIAGMGGMLIVEILLAGQDILQDCTQLVLQPQSDIDKVRRFIRDNGFMIDVESMVKEDGKFYTSIHAVKSKTKIKGYNLEEDTLFDLYGEYLLTTGNEVLKEQLLHQYGILKNSLEHIKTNESSNLTTLKKKIKIIEKGLTYYGM